MENNRGSWSLAVPAAEDCLPSDHHPTRHEQRTRFFQIFCIQFHSSLSGRKRNREVEIAGTARADFGRKVHWERADHNISRHDVRNVKMFYELGPYCPVVPLCPLDGARVTRNEKAACVRMVGGVVARGRRRVVDHAAILQSKLAIVR